MISGTKYGSNISTCITHTHTHIHDKGWIQLLKQVLLSFLLGKIH
jgi:hypothetical protein